MLMLQMLRLNSILAPIENPKFHTQARNGSKPKQMRIIRASARASERETSRGKKIRFKIRTARNHSAKIYKGKLKTEKRRGRKEDKKITEKRKIERI